MKMLAAAATVAVLVLAAGGASAVTDEALFPISFWVGAPPQYNTAGTYARMAAGGFTVALGGAGNAEYNRQMLYFCAQNGLKAIVLDDRIWQAISGVQGWERLLDGVVRDYGGNPALLAYFLTDEPNSAQFPALARVKEYLAKADPAHWSYINLFPNYASREQLGNETYREHVSQFLEVVKPAVLSWDHYALLADSERANYFENLEVCREETLRAGVPFWQIILSTPHYGYRDPKPGDFRWQDFTTLAYGGKGIMYFTYWAVSEFQNAVVDAEGRPTGHYPMIRRVNERVLAWAPVLLRCRSLAVYHAEPLPLGTHGVSPNPVVEAIQGDGLVGVLKDDAGTTYLLVVNRSPRAESRVRVTLREGVRHAAFASGTEPLIWRPIVIPESSRCLSMRLSPGQARLLRLGT